MSQKIYPITAEHLFGILNNPKFKDNLRELNDDLINERSFLVQQRVYDSRYFVGDVMIGTPDNAFDSDKDESERASILGIDQMSEMASGGVLPLDLLRVHSHASGGVTPSPFGDLEGLATDRDRARRMGGYSLLLKPIDGIVAAFGRPTIEFILIQEDTKMPIPASEADYLDQLTDELDESNATPEEVAKALEETGLYHALALKLKNGKLPKKYIDLLRKFEFTPEVKFCLSPSE